MERQLDRIQLYCVYLRDLIQHFLVLDLVDTVGRLEVLNRIMKLNKEIYISSNKEYTFLKWKYPLLSQGKVKILLPFNSISFYMMLRNDPLFLPSNIDACRVPCLISIQWWTRDTHFLHSYNLMSREGISY